LRGLDCSLPLIWVGPDREPRVRSGHGNLRGVDDDAGVERDDPSLVGKQRIDVELAQRRSIHYELRTAHQRVGNRLEIRRRPVAISFQEIVDARLAHEVAGELAIERRQRHRAIPYHLGGDPSCAEEDDRVKQAIL